MRRINVLGIEFDNTSIREAVDFAIRLMDEDETAYAVTPNPEIVLAASNSKKLRRAINRADLVLPDGIGVIYASRILGSPLKNRVAGIDFASALMARMAERGMSIYLLGAKAGVAEIAAEKLSGKYPGLEIKGCHHGYFDNDEVIIEEINQARPDLLLVCLGSPKQELWMAANRDELNVGFMVGLGGALDVYAGLVQRAPARWRDMGLEWLYRLIKEPRRIKRMIKLPLIILAAIWRRIRG